MALRYLVINHPQDADVKTILAYDTPTVVAPTGFLNFDDSDDNASSVDVTLPGTGAQTVTLDFTYGGSSNYPPQPVIGDFTFTPTTGVSAEQVTLNSGAGTGTLQYTMGSNNAGNSTERETDITFTADISNANQLTNRHIITVKQPGNFQQGNQGKF
tara:strand:- start:84 stop:554 length:471 start_codon:yes stop_codon:yes gene_type:complete